MSRDQALSRAAEEMVRTFVADYRDEVSKNILRKARVTCHAKLDQEGHLYISDTVIFHLDDKGFKVGNPRWVIGQLVLLDLAFIIQGEHMAAGEQPFIERGELRDRFKKEFHLGYTDRFFATLLSSVIKRGFLERPSTGCFEPVLTELLVG